MRCRSFILGLLVALPLTTFAAPASLPDRLRDPQGAPLVVSHRACWKFASENTLEGIAACIARNVDMVEIDIRTTRDGALVLMHDETVDRTTNGHGAVSELTAAQITALNVREQGGGPDSKLTQRHPPTFMQALTAIRGRVLMNLDVKTASLDQIMDEVEAAGAQRDVLLNVPLDVPAAAVERAHKADIAIQVLYTERTSPLPPEQAFRQAMTMHPAVVQVMFDDPAVVDIAQRVVNNHARLLVNTMTNDIASGKPMRLSATFTDARAIQDPLHIWGELRKHGVSMLQTDEPMAVMDYLHQQR